MKQVTTPSSELGVFSACRFGFCHQSELRSDSQLPTQGDRLFSNFFLHKSFIKKPGTWFLKFRASRESNIGWTQLTMMDVIDCYLETIKRHHYKDFPLV